jgi:hypothetical protein
VSIECLIQKIITDMHKKIFLLLVISWLSLGGIAQHDHHPTTADTVKPGHTKKMPVKKDTMKMDPMYHSRHMDTGSHSMDMPMNHAFSLNLPMNRNGSGTGWLPDASPMYGYMIHSRKWMYMVHGSVFARYNNQNFNNDDRRGGSKFDAPTWFMLMGQRKMGAKGLFHFSSMFSLDPLIEGGKGYPLLFQTGETYKGRPLIDRQHPHDLFSELSVSYAHAFSKKVDAFVYFGYPGEPALGPVTFMHRPSSLDNPNSPVSHHWVDATHITFGVITAGIRTGKFKLEGSSFTGREPDEDRYGFDKPRFDSWSGRLSFNPSKNFAMQVSHGFVNSPEPLHAGEDVNKTTASVIYSSDMKNGSQLNATALWGMNKQKHHDGENAFLLEGAWRMNRASMYTRYEFAKKSAEELVLETVFDEHDTFGIHAFTAGFNYDLLEFQKTRVAAGGQWSIYGAPQELKTFYGKNPMSFQLYLRVYPSLMK